MNQTVVHACPPDGGGGFMPCCGKTPFEARGDRIATNPDLVTCWTADDPRLAIGGGA